jgi:hypothetical protein
MGSTSSRFSIKPPALDVATKRPFTWGTSAVRKTERGPAPQELCRSAIIKEGECGLGRERTDAMRNGFLVMAAVVGLTVGVGTAQAGDHHHHGGGGHAVPRSSAAHGAYHASGHYGGAHYGGYHGFYYGHPHYGYYGHGGYYGGFHGSLAFGFGYPAPYYGYGYYGYAPYPPPYYGAYATGPAYGYGGYPPPNGGGDDEGDEDADNVDPSQMNQRGQAPNGAAQLRLVVTPPDASVYVDGQMAGIARDLRSVPVAPGQHRVEAVRPGYQGLSRVVDVASGQPAAVEMDLEPAR